MSGQNMLMTIRKIKNVINMSQCEQTNKNKTKVVHFISIYKVLVVLIIFGVELDLDMFMRSHPF